MSTWAEYEKAREELLDASFAYEAECANQTSTTETRVALLRKVKAATEALDAIVRAMAEDGERDAFYGGFCCALSAALYGHDGTSTEYLEAVGTVNEKELLAFAEKNEDMELPRIKKAIRWIKDSERRRKRSALPPAPRTQEASNG